MNPDEYGERRRAMVKHLRAAGIRDELVLSAMSAVERHRFFPGGPPSSVDPYGDHPCEIGFGQTVSQPFIVAYMIEKLMLEPGARVLEIGTGSGYQAAVLFEMGMEVFTVEVVAELYSHAKGILHPEIHIRKGDGFRGWLEEAPFQGIILSCAPLEIPGELVKQLDSGARMILPAGGFMQRLFVVSRRNGDVSVSEDLPVRFVPMVGNSTSEDE
jgi:protein-L-isoaspartate(D-aspartate) O-methyltransferase